MRLRNKPWAADKLREHPQYVVWEDADIKGNWQNHFQKRATNPLRSWFRKRSFYD